MTLYSNMTHGTCQSASMKYHSTEAGPLCSIMDITPKKAVALVLMDLYLGFILSHEWVPKANVDLSKHLKSN